MIFYRELVRQTREQFGVIIDYTYDHTNPIIVFPPKQFNTSLIFSKIDSGEYEYFNLRIRIFFEDKLVNQGTIEHCLEKSVDSMLLKDADIIDEFIETLVLEAKHDLKL